MAEQPHTSLEERLRQEAAAADREAMREELVTITDIEHLLLDGTPEAMVSKNYKELMPGWNAEREQVKMLWLDFKNRIFDAAMDRLERGEQLTEHTRKELEGVAEPVRVFVEEAMGMTQSIAAGIKIERTPYSEQDKKNNDPMEMGELRKLRGVLENLRNTDVDEMVDMVFDDHVLLDWLQPEVDIADELKELQENDVKNTTHHYREHMDQFVDFVLEQREQDDKVKSDTRKVLEQGMWCDMLKKMSSDQRFDAVGHILERATPEQARKFIATALQRGALTRNEVMHMQEEADANSETLQQRGFAKLKGLAGEGVKFEEFVRQNVALREAIIAATEEEMRVAEDPGIQNAVVHYFTLEKAAGETIARWGAITAIVNFALSIFDRIKDRGHDSMAVAIAKGVKDGLTDKTVMAGVAAGIVGSNIIHPWVRRAVHAPSDEQELEKSKMIQKRYLHEQADNHPEVILFLREHFEDLEQMADPDMNHEKSEKFDLKPADIVKNKRLGLTDAAAYEWGYPSAEAAAAHISRLFYDMWYMFKLRDGEHITDEDSLQTFLESEGIYRESQTDINE